MQAVTGLAWAGQHHLFSASLDHTMKRWDVGSGVAVETLPTGKALLCCAAGHEEAGRPAVLAAGSADGALRWWDCRAATRSSEALVCMLPHHALRALAVYMHVCVHLWPHVICCVIYQ